MSHLTLEGAQLRFALETELPPGAGLCAVTSAAVGMPGSLAYRIK
jgi:hypothetical protein